MRVALTRTLVSLFWLATAIYALLSAIPFDRKAEKSPLITEGSAQSTRAEARRSRGDC